MKLILLSLFAAFLGVCMPNEISPDFMSNSLIRSMSKVRGSSGFLGGDEATMCIERCTAQIIVALQDDEETRAQFTNISSPTRNEKSQNKEAWIKMCRFANESNTCIQPCGQCPSKQLAASAHSFFKYVCKDTNFLEHAPCYEKVNRQMVSVCNSDDKCGRQKATMLNEATRPPTPSDRPTATRQVESVFKDYCEYFNCYSECEREKLVQECGNEAKNVLEGFYKKAVTAAVEMAEIHDLNIVMPNECKRSMTADDDDN